MLATLLTLAAGGRRGGVEQDARSTSWAALAAVWAIVLFAVGMRSPDVPRLGRRRSAA